MTSTAQDGSTPVARYLIFVQWEAVVMCHQSKLCQWSGRASIYSRDVLLCYIWIETKYQIDPWVERVVQLNLNLKVLTFPLPTTLVQQEGAFSEFLVSAFQNIPYSQMHVMSDTLRLLCTYI